MKNNSKALCLLLAGTMAVSNCPVSVQAAEADNNFQEIVAEETVETTEEARETEVEETVEEVVQEEVTQEETVETVEEVTQEETVETVEEVAQEEVTQEETVETVEEVVQEEVTQEEDVETVEEVVQEESVNATSLTNGDFTYTEDSEGITITDYEGKASTLDIAEAFSGQTVVAIGTAAFRNNDYISHVILPDTVKTIGNSAFVYCDALAKVSVFGGESSLETIGSDAFFACSVLSVFPFEGVKSIGENAFCNTSLTEVTLPEGLSALGQNAFKNCDSLSKVIFPSTLNAIGAYAFYDSDVLSKITIPEGCATIGQQAFYSCGSLSVVEFYSDTVTIYDDSFKNCNSQLVFYGEPGTTAESAAEKMGFRFNRYTDSIKIKTPPAKTEYLYGEDLNTTGLVVEVDYTSDTEPATQEVTADLCNFSGYSKNKIGKQTVTVSYAGKEATFDINMSYDLSGATIDNISDQTYTGAAITPEITVTGKETKLTLVKDKDYAVEYLEDHTNVGTATVQITGMGNYKGTATKTFKIVAKSLGAKEISASVPTVTYNGSAQEPAPAVQDGTTTLTLKDYTVVSYSSNTNAGTGTVRIDGKGNYKGSVYIDFTIAPKDINDFQVADIPDQIYTGYELTPNITIPLDEYSNLVKGTDYTVRYKDNTEKGIAKVSITGKGNYTGTIEKTFTIKAKALADVTVEAIADQTYTGNAIEPTVSIYNEKYDETLEEGSDYTVTYDNNTNAGTATITIKGMGSYEGTLEKTFTIKAKNLADVTVDAIADQAFTGKAIEPSVSVYDSNHNVTLVEGTDYTVIYADNVNGGTATVSIQGMGNYEGTIEKTFTIKPERITSSEIEVSNIDTCVYSGEEQKPSFKVVFDEETELLENTDYTVTYKDNVQAGTGIIVIEGIGNYRGTVEKEFTIRPKKLEGVTVNDLPGYTYTGEAIKPAIDVKLEGVSLKSGVDYKVSYSNNINAGTATVSITGIGNYDGMIERTFDIKRKSIADIGIKTIPDHIYTGAELEPVVSLELDIYTMLTKGVDYQVTYQNNVNVGKATVQVQGIGNYTGVIEKTFKITPKSIADASLVLSEIITNYDGAAKMPTVSVVSGNKTLSSGTEYTVTYGNNKNIGTATVSVKGIGNYTGTISKNFTIQAKKGSTFTVGAYKYKITNANEVAFTGLKSSKTKKVTIPAEVKIGGKKFKVTSIANKTLKSKSVTSVTIGKNVKTIGTSAFQSCSKLKKITVKGTVLKKVGKNAFKGINAKAKIKVPKKKLSAYKKLMKSKGQSKTVKITK